MRGRAGRGIAASIYAGQTIIITTGVDIRPIVTAAHHDKGVTFAFQISTFASEQYPPHHHALTGYPELTGPYSYKYM